MYVNNNILIIWVVGWGYFWLCCYFVWKLNLDLLLVEWMF